MGREQQWATGGKGGFAKCYIQYCIVSVGATILQYLSIRLLVLNITILHCWC